jgi:gamma-polyglutamate biosynthesis protein CapA
MSSKFSASYIFVILVLLGMAGALVVLIYRSDFLFTASAEVVKVLEPKPVSVLFVGDIMLDRHVALHVERIGQEKFLENIAPLFKDYDLTVGNLEGTITNNPSVSRADTSIMRFTFAPALAEYVLKTLRLDMVSLANNHALDFGASGYSETRSFLAKHHVLYFGSPSNSENLSVIKLVRGKPMCFVGYQDFVQPDAPKINAEVARLDPLCYKVIVFAHWGEEYLPEATGRQKTLAHGFVDSGADLVIGAHPHVVEPYEVYKNTAIFYSLGNFIFDQYFSLPTRRGLIVAAEFDSKEARFTLTPVAIERDGISPLESEEESFSVLQKP